MGCLSLSNQLYSSSYIIAKPTLSDIYFQIFSPSLRLTWCPYHLQWSDYRIRGKCLEAAEALADFLNHEAKTEKKRQVGWEQKEAIPGIGESSKSGEEYSLPSEWDGQDIKSFGAPEMWQVPSGRACYFWGQTGTKSATSDGSHLTWTPWFSTPPALWWHTQLPFLGPLLWMRCSPCPLAACGPVGVADVKRGGDFNAMWNDL